MANESRVGGSGGKSSPAAPALRSSDIPGSTAQNGLTGGNRSRPVQARGNYPERTVTWYHISRSDIRNLSVASWATTLFTAVGTYGLTVYLDFSKDIQLSTEAPEHSVELLSSVAAIAFAGWIFCWAMALVAFLWRERELLLIKEEHGELPWWKRFRSRN